MIKMDIWQIVLLFSFCSQLCSLNHNKKLRHIKINHQKPVHAMIHKLRILTFTKKFTTLQQTVEYTIRPRICVTIQAERFSKL